MRDEMAKGYHPTSGSRPAGREPCRGTGAEAGVVAGTDDVSSFDAEEEVDAEVDEGGNSGGARGSEMGVEVAVPAQTVEEREFPGCSKCVPVG